MGERLGAAYEPAFHWNGGFDEKFAEGERDRDLITVQLGLGF